MTLTDEERKAKRKELKSKPEYKAKEKEHRATPEQKAYQKEYRSTPEHKAKAKERASRPENKAKAKEREQTPKYIAKRKERDSRPKRKAYQKAYKLRPGYKAEQKKYRLKPENKTREKLLVYKIRLKVLQYYSKRLSKSNIPCCNCCGENFHIDFLAIDHKAGKKQMDSESELLKLGYSSSFSGKKLLNWIIKNNFPDGFQILCHNCNVAKGIVRNKNKCPHEK